MRNPVCLLALAVLGILSTGRAIEFELKELHIKDLDGDKIDRYFPNGATRVFYRPPPMWTWTGSATRFETSPPGPRSGRLLIQAMKPATDSGQPGDANQLEAFKKLALASLTPNAQDPQVIDATVGKLGGAELPFTRVTIKYQRSVQARTVTLCYALFRPEIWLQFVVDAAKEDYALSSGEAFQSLEGFTEVQAEVPKPGGN